MRIIAGVAKGRLLDTPREGTRPMTGRARESLFSILARRLEGASVLDLYAGSGSLGLEALSRGACEAIFVERERGATAVLAANIERVGLGGRVKTTDVVSYLRSAHARFDLVFVDPPYRDDDVGVLATLQLLDRVLEPSGMVVMQRQARSSVGLPDFLCRVDERRYGDAVITMMERVNT